MNEFDFLIVGAGLFGCVCADQLTKKGYKVVVIDKMSHIGGTCFTDKVDDIDIHKYGAHIFRTNSKQVFDYISSFSSFNNFINSPIAIYHGKAYNLPFNMNTFAKLWDVRYPFEAKKIIDEEILKFNCSCPINLEEKAITMVGKTVYEMFIKEYTEKQWGKKCSDLPESIIRRIPIRYSFDNNYYNAVYQGIPIDGYTAIFKKMLKNSIVLLNNDFNSNKMHFFSLAKKIIYTGPIDEYFDFCFGELEYRGLKFIEKKYMVDNFQGNAVFNYCDNSVAYTRSIEHKFFNKSTNSNSTIVSYEYPCSWKRGEYPFYPLEDKKNIELFYNYKKLADKEKKVIFGGRLGDYKYYDMQDTIIAALDLCSKIKI